MISSFEKILPRMLRVLNTDSFSEFFKGFFVKILHSQQWIHPILSLHFTLTYKQIGYLLGTAQFKVTILITVVIDTLITMSLITLRDIEIQLFLLL